MLVDLLRKLARVIGLGSPPLATAPPWFPAEGPGSCASLAARCGFVMADSVRESGAVTPGKYLHYCVQDWPGARRRSAPTPLRRGLCGYAASPAPVFSAPARGTRSRVLLLEREHSSLQETFPLYTVLPKRHGEVRQEGMRQKESHRQHSEKQPVVTARVVGKDGWDRAPGLPRSVLAASGQTGRLTGTTVGAGSWLDHRRSALFSHPVASTKVSSKTESS